MEVAMTSTLAVPLARRELHSLTGDTEKRLLVSIARRLPAWVSSDKLTALGALGLAGAGFCYRLVPLTSWALVGVNLFLFANWFGDSLDGTLARVRRRERPRYGFYLDHVVDALGTLLLLAGLAGSGLVPAALAWALLVAYLVLQVEIALKAHAAGVFQIAFGGIGGTELRIALACLNFAVLARPDASALFEGAAWLALAGIGATLAIDTLRTAALLRRSEAWPA
jgi:archaetidylinositol phosphate synthase